MPCIGERIGLATPKRTDRAEDCESRPAQFPPGPHFVSRSGLVWRGLIRRRRADSYFRQRAISLAARRDSLHGPLGTRRRTPGGDQHQGIRRPGRTDQAHGHNRGQRYFVRIAGSVGDRDPRKDFRKLKKPADEPNYLFPGWKIIRPPRMVNRTFAKLVTSSAGSAFRTTRSASMPGAIVPRFSDSLKRAAGALARLARTCIGVRPASFISMNSSRGSYSVI